MASLNFAEIFVGFAILVISLTVHEAAHAWTADRLGDPTARRLGRVSFNPAAHVDPIGTIVFPLVAMLTHVPLIGWARPVPVDGRNLRSPRRDFVLVAAAGPASNLALALVASVLLGGLTSGAGAVSGPLVYVAIGLGQLVLINVLLAVFNMIPIPPLDGGNVLSGLLPYRAALGFNRLRPYGFLLLYALLLSGAFERLVWPPAQFLTTVLLRGLA